MFGAEEDEGLVPVRHAVDHVREASDVVCDGKGFGDAGHLRDVNQIIR